MNHQDDVANVRSPTGRRKTQSLFKETIQIAQLKRYPACYTLMEKEQWCGYHEIVIPSAKEIYVNSDSEYEAAMTLVGSIEHWNMLLANDWFVNGTDDYNWTSLTQWRQEQQGRKQHIAESALMKLAQQGNVAAAKALLANKDMKRGRPSSDEVEGERKKAAKAKSVTDGDAQRIGLQLVKR